MITQFPVRSRAQVQVKPIQSRIVATDNYVIAFWVQRHVGDALHVRIQLLYQLLLCEIVYSNMPFGSNEEVWP
ncbi:hypothetical protein M514_18656 [Trichuris suis]|uniref:Uncharacterized protein n=1 Tax=Trichuris suis TaxID=68888 RepID=A0A085NHY3_9BILA|nr:hypothetical protein M514_18656 [Trichuris suis]